MSPGRSFHSEGARAGEVVVGPGPSLSASGLDSRLANRKVASAFRIPKPRVGPSVSIDRRFHINRG
eukprot:9500672-Pyramimonas_sp.AAC.2